MKMTFQKLVIGASMAIGVSAIATVPAQAGTLTGATIAGTAASDYLVYDVSGNSTVLVSNTPDKRPKSPRWQCCKPHWKRRVTS